MKTISDKQYEAVAVLSALAGVDAVDIGMRNAAGSFQPLSNLDTCSDALDAALVACRAANSAGRDIYFRPARGVPASVVMLDDISRELAFELCIGVQHLLIETSPGNFQVWLKTSRLLGEMERKAIQIALVSLHGGDTGSTSGEHFGRLPGFKNRKPKYKLPWVNLVRYALDGEVLDVDAFSHPPRGACALEPAAGESVRSASAPAATTRRAVGGGDSQESHKEFRFACESLRHNVNPENIITNIAQRALARGKRRTATAAETYARRTVAAASRAVT